MPIEYELLKNKHCAATDNCCANKCEPLMRGCVQSGWRKFFGLPYCAVICPISKEIIGWEKPEKRKRPF
jgi:hypothetical protein